MPRTKREQTDPEIVFTLLKALLLGWCVWGTQSTVQLSELLRMDRATPAKILRALVCLRAQGLVRIDHERGVVSLSSDALNELVGGVSG